MGEVVMDLSPEQLEGLAYLGELTGTIKTLLDGPMGAVLVQYAVDGTARVPEGTLDALTRVLRMVVDWNRDGILEKVGEMVGLMAAMLNREALDFAVEAPLKALRGGVMDEARQVLSDADKKGTGGLGGMMRVMSDPEVQVGLMIMAELAGKIGKSFRSNVSS